MDFGLRQLEVYCAVVEQQSFSRGAEAVHLSQASVSERISKLERSVGVVLLHRSGRVVSPTEIGRRFYVLARDLLDSRRAMVLEVEDLLDLRTGTLIIGASTIPGEFVLPGRLSAFQKMYPGVKLTLMIGDSTGIASRVVGGELELGVVGAEVGSCDLTATPIWRDELVLAVPESHDWAGRSAIGIDELTKEPFLLREPGSGTRRTLETALARALPGGVEGLTVAAELGSTTAVKEGVLQGLGVSILSVRAVERELACRTVATVRVEGLDLTRWFHLVRHRKRALSPAALRCAEYLQSIAG